MCLTQGIGKNIKVKAIIQSKNMALEKCSLELKLVSVLCKPKVFSALVNLCQVPPVSYRQITPGDPGTNHLQEKGEGVMPGLSEDT